VGLNNSTIYRPQFRPGGESQIERSLPLHSHWLLGTIETGFVGVGLFALFFLLVVREAWRATASSDPGVAALALGILGAYSALGFHAIVDYVGSGSLQALIWFYAGVAMTFRRALQVPAVDASLAARSGPVKRYTFEPARMTTRLGPRSTYRQRWRSRS
jgi:O-antigen ligase